MKALLIILGMLAVVGCGKTFYTHVEGENDAIGIRLPLESDVQLNVIHHVNGTTLTVHDPSKINHQYETCISNNYFGVVKIFEWRKGAVNVCPTNSVQSLQ